MKLWPLAAVTAVQLFLALAHGFIYWTWISFWNPLPELALLLLRVGLTVLAFSFAATTLRRQPEAPIGLKSFSKNVSSMSCPFWRGLTPSGNVAGILALRPSIPT